LIPTMKDTEAINRFLLSNGLTIRQNPAVSPDLCLDPPTLERSVREALPALRSLVHSPGQTAPVVPRKPVGGLDFFPASELGVGPWRFFLVEDRATGDGALLACGKEPLPARRVVVLEAGLALVPLLWDNLVTLKNLVLEHDPESTVFPVARGSLAKSSLGIGARFTTLHWPAVAWAMKELRLSLTANQNSIPRELVYDVDAMLENRLAEVPFPFIGGSVPEGHQGQSVEGMTHAGIVTFLKYGFHRQRIPWGFNADHQPIGGRFDAIEEALARGCAFASYITFDLSPELAGRSLIDDADEIERAFNALGELDLFRRVVARLRQLGFSPSETQAKRIFIFVQPAMRKLKRRDEAYTRVRQELFATEPGRRYFRELSIDELPGRTAPETLALCLAMAEALGVNIHFVAPNIGFQKNFPYPDNAELKATVETLYAVARAFGASIGFHSGSGKSLENYRAVGEATRRNLEIKTSGRYTYEMGVALSRARNAQDQGLWQDWYAFTRELALEGAFSKDPVRQRFARDFIRHALQHEGRSDAVFESPTALRRTLETLAPSPDHMFWFEYNFLYQLAGGGSAARLGDHGPAGYAQRGRFYGISDETRLNFAKNVANYILFLAETTGLSTASAVAEARSKLAAFSDYEALLSSLVA